MAHFRNFKLERINDSSGFRFVNSMSFVRMGTCDVFYTSEERLIRYGLWELSLSRPISNARLSKTHK